MEATAFSYISSVIADWASMDRGRMLFGPPRGATGGGILTLGIATWTGGWPLVGEVASGEGLEDGFSPLLSILTLLLLPFAELTTGIAYPGSQPSLIPGVVSRLGWFDWFEEEPPETTVEAVAGGLLSFFALRPRLGAVVGEDDDSECSSLVGLPVGKPFCFASGLLF